MPTPLDYYQSLWHLDHDGETVLKAAHDGFLGQTVRGLPPSINWDKTLEVTDIRAESTREEVVKTARKVIQLVMTLTPLSCLNEDDVMLIKSLVIYLAKQIDEETLHEMERQKEPACLIRLNELIPQQMVHGIRELYEEVIDFCENPLSV